MYWCLKSFGLIFGSLLPCLVGRSFDDGLATKRTQVPTPLTRVCRPRVPVVGIHDSLPNVDCHNNNPSKGNKMLSYWYYCSLLVALVDLERWTV